MFLIKLNDLESDDKPTNKVETEGHVGPIFEVKFDLVKYLSDFL